MNTSAASVETLSKPVVQWLKPMPQLIVQTAMWVPFACCRSLQVSMLEAHQRTRQLLRRAPWVVVVAVAPATEIQ